MGKDTPRILDNIRTGKPCTKDEPLDHSRLPGTGGCWHLKTKRFDYGFLVTKNWVDFVIVPTKTPMSTGSGGNPAGTNKETMKFPLMSV